MTSLMGSIGRACLCLVLFALLPFEIATAQSAQGTDPLSALIALGGAMLTSTLLGGVKKLDTSITNAPLFRKLQPVITLGGAFLMPWVASHVGVNVDPSALAAAPIATIATITGAELLSLFTKRKGG